MNVLLHLRHAAQRTLTTSSRTLMPKGPSDHRSSRGGSRSSFRPASHDQARDKEIKQNPNKIFRPVVVLHNIDDKNGVGEELAGKISKSELLHILNMFYSRKEVMKLSKEHGLDTYLYQQAYISFRKYCMQIDCLPTDLYVTIGDLIKGVGHVDDLYPYFLTHARKVFPHLECIEDLKVGCRRRHY